MLVFNIIGLDPWHEYVHEYAPMPTAISTFIYIYLPCSPLEFSSTDSCCCVPLFASIWSASSFIINAGICSCAIWLSAEALCVSDASFLDAGESLKACASSREMRTALVPDTGSPRSRQSSFRSTTLHVILITVTVCPNMRRMRCVVGGVMYLEYWVCGICEFAYSMRMRLHVCLQDYVCVCVWERERERESMHTRGTHTGNLRCYGEYKRARGGFIS